MTASIISILLGVATAAFAAAPEGATARVHLQSRDNAPIGEATLRETPNGVLLTADLRDLPPGTHAFHIHQTGKCQPPFETAGGHFNPTGVPHGFGVAKGPHAGDLPNIFVPESGRVKVEVLIPGVTLGSGARNSLLDPDGSALVVHAGADDHVTDPAGAAGDRIACGVVERPASAAGDSPAPRAER